MNSTEEFFDDDGTIEMTATGILNSAADLIEKYGFISNTELIKTPEDVGPAKGYDIVAALDQAAFGTVEGPNPLMYLGFMPYPEAYTKVADAVRIKLVDGMGMDDQAVEEWSRAGTTETMTAFLRGLADEVAAQEEETAE